MKRRSALTALACALGASAAPAGRRTATLVRVGVLAWGPEGCWVDVGGSALHALPDRLAPGIAPVPTADGLWLVTAAGALRCWEAAAALSWQVRCTVEFAAPVHALAASPDGRSALAAHGEQLSLLDRRGEVIKIFEGSDLTREHRGAATALFALPQRRSLVAAWPALGELWEISLDPAAAPIFDGLVHDYRMSEGIATPGYLGVRRSPLGRPMPTISFADARVPWLAGSQGNEVIVVHLDVRRRIAALRADTANPAGATLRVASHEPGAVEWWLPAGNDVHVFDTTRWAHMAMHALPGPVRQLQAVDGAVWARVGERGAAQLFLLRDGAAGAWQRVSGAPGPLVALRADPRGSRLLALQAHPPALSLLGSGDGSVLRNWPLPRDAEFHGAAWVAGA
jgi:hypothetical protein